MSEKLPYQTLLEGDLPPWVMRLVKATGRAINRYSMIRDGDTILLGTSGGKDSLALALALSLRKKWLPIDYTLKA
ncbi:MAG TPA: adenine nucleotide alpha hydrolase, partial [Sphaerochaeta sp.]|nr:adenine nucleotide alpha hydrolase [Sphaerochaeta sp.]